MKKIVSQKTEPKDTSVIWLDSNTQQLKSFNNGNWVSLGTDNDSIAELISDGNPIQVQINAKPTDNEPYAPFTPTKKAYLYLPGYWGLYNVIETNTGENLSPDYEFNNGHIYLLEPKYTYHIVVLYPDEALKFNPYRKIYYYETIGQNVILNSICECIFSHVDNNILFYRDANSSKTIDYNYTLLRVGSKIKFRDCETTIIAVYANIYNGKFICEPVTIYSPDDKAFITVEISGNIYTDGMIPVCTLSFLFSNSTSDTGGSKYVLFNLKDTTKKISTTYQDCNLYLSDSSSSTVTPDIDLLDGYKLIHPTEMWCYLFTGAISESGTSGEVFVAGDYLITFNTTSQFWQIRLNKKDNSNGPRLIYTDATLSDLTSKTEVVLKYKDTDEVVSGDTNIIGYTILVTDIYKTINTRTTGNGNSPDTPIIAYYTDNINYYFIIEYDINSNKWSMIYRYTD